MATTNTIQLELTYTDYSTRTYKIPLAEYTSEGIATAKTAIRNFNTAASTAGSSVQQTFLSEDGAAVARISDATVVNRTEEVIYGG